MTDDELRALLGNEQQVNAAMQEESAPSVPAPEQEQSADAQEVSDAERNISAEVPPAEPFMPPDPFALLNASQPKASETAPAEAAAPPTPDRHIFLYLMLALLVIGVRAFSVFCV